MRKNILKISAIALLSAFVLTACDDDIIAKPTGYDDKNSPVVTIKDDSGKDVTVYNNDFTAIYDYIRDGNLASDVLNELLYQYATSVFGNYNKITAAKISNNSFGEITLKQAVKSLSGDKADANKFIKAHSAYWTKDANGKRIDDTGKAVTTAEEKDADASLSEYARLENKWKTIEKRIAEKMFAAISGGSYSDRNVFEEERFLKSLAADIENNVDTSAGVKTFKGILTADVEDYDIFNETIEQGETYEKGKTLDIDGNMDYILHRANYQSSYALTAEEKADDKATYVEDKLIPDIYRQLLVEQYILDESYNTLGRTSAREIDVLAISKSSDYAKGAVNLMNTFINNRIFDVNRAANDPITLSDFKEVSRAWVGAFMDNEDYSDDGAHHSREYNYMKAAVSEYEVLPENGNPGYFKGTAFGDMMEEIEKINDNPKLSENESTYTGSNAYTVEVGKEIKTRELQLKDNTFTGWYVKSVGVAGLPESVKNQLFDINVANALNGSECIKYEVVDGKWTTTNEDANKTSVINVVGEVNGQYFLRNTSRIKGNPVQDDLLFESDGTYYIVLVQNAIRSKNLNKKDYERKENQSEAEYTAELDKLETYINEIVQIVADNDTYQTLSKKHWIENMNLKYHDTVIYNYFKSTFPELFED